jgi:hypothetical protein
MMISYLLRRQDIAKEDLLDLPRLDFWHTLNGSYIHMLFPSSSQRKRVLSQLTFDGNTAQLSGTEGRKGAVVVSVYLEQAAGKLGTHPKKDPIGVLTAETM